MPGSRLAEDTFPNGTRVRRGPDWSEGSKDGFPGNIGTVIRQDDNGYIKCIFDGESAEVPSLRMGVRDLYEVQLAFGSNDWLSAHSANAMGWSSPKGLAGLEASSHSRHSTVARLLESGTSQWQSSGSNPHTITMTFDSAFNLGTLTMQFGTPGLWSYEPKRVVVSAGADLSSLSQVAEHDFSSSSAQSHSGSYPKTKELLQQCNRHYKYVKLEISAHGGDVQLVGLGFTEGSGSSGGNGVGGAGEHSNVDASSKKRKNVLQPGAAGKIDPVPKQALLRIAGVATEGAVGAADGQDGNRAIASAETHPTSIAIQDIGRTAALFPADLSVAESLDDAVAALKGAQLVQNIDARLEAAKEKAKATEITHPKIPEHMRAALAFYVADEAEAGAEAGTAGAAACVYDLIDQALKSTDRSALLPWRDLVWLVLHAWKLVRPEPESTIYRGCNIPLSELPMQYTENSSSSSSINGSSGGGAGDESNDTVLCWAGASPAATSMHILRTLLGQEGPRSYFALKLGSGGGSSQARDLSYFGRYYSDRIRPPVVYLPPGIQFTVKSVTTLGNGVAMVRCIETTNAGAVNVGGFGRILDTSYIGKDGSPTPATQLQARGPLMPRTGSTPGSVARADSDSDAAASGVDGSNSNGAADGGGGATTVLRLPEDNTSDDDDDGEDDEEEDDVYSSDPGSEDYSEDYERDSEDDGGSDYSD